MPSNNPLSEMKFRDTELPIELRVRDLISRLSLKEKVSQMIHNSPPVERLGIPSYNWWNECLHGVARAGVATVFPQSIGLAATWNPELIHAIADAISEEARAKHHEFIRQGDHGQYKGLTFWSPNINIARDPRWGRTQETYGEDPYLTRRMAVEFVKGLQGNDPKYLKAVATPKHFAVHSGPESERHHFNAEASPRDMAETYLPAFKASVQEAKAESIMGAYNRTNGEPCCASKTLLIDILRKEWGFDGYVVSDCGAIHDIHTHHKVTGSPAESAALAVKNGCELNCGIVYPSLLEAVEQGLIEEKVIDEALERLLRARFKLGLFDPPEEVPYASIPYEKVDCPEHQELARLAARQSFVLLKNENSLLPLNRDLKTLAVIGPTADDRKVLLGNYYGTPSRPITLLEGIRQAVSPKTRLIYAPGCQVTAREIPGVEAAATHGFTEALSAARYSDIIIACMGYTPELEGEEGEVADSDGGGDKMALELPEIQRELLRKLAETGKPIVLVLTGGSPISLASVEDCPDSVLLVWYPGQAGGTALADILFGDNVPAGRLPMTFPRSLEQLPPFRDYRMQGRTYKYMNEEPLYRFGFGLSYTKFEYREPVLNQKSIEAGQSLDFQVEVLNAGSYDAEEVVQIYIQKNNRADDDPILRLVQFKRVYIQSGEKVNVEFSVPPERLSYYDQEGRPNIEPGDYTLFAGGCCPGYGDASIEGAPVKKAAFAVVGNKITLD
jgi:beta-glucosidase